VDRHIPRTKKPTPFDVGLCYAEQGRFALRLAFSALYRFTAVPVKAVLFTEVPFTEVPFIEVLRSLPEGLSDRRLQ
jgi:hypothetical protein